MVLNIKIADDQWMVKDLIGENILENKNIFINYLMEFVTPNLKSIDSCDEVDIVLPTVVTKSERHQIHKMTSSWFSSTSYNNTEDERYMVITLMKKLVIDWVTTTGYQFPPEPIPIEEEFEVDPPVEVVVQDNNQQEFNVLMKIILAHYPDELRKWNENQN